MKKTVIALLFCIVPYMSASLRSCNDVRFLLQRGYLPHGKKHARARWQTLFNRSVVTNQASSQELMDIRYQVAQELLEKYPDLINVRSFSNDTCLTFIAFLRARPNTRNDDAYWGSITQFFLSKGAQ